MTALTICSDFGAQENEVSHCFHCFSIYLPWTDGTTCHDLSFLSVELSLSSFTFIKRLFSSYSLSAIRVVSSAYLRLLIFLPTILVTTCASFHLAFRMMYSAYKLNKQGDNIRPWCTPFPIWNQSVVPCPVLTGASLLAYRFLRRKVRWSCIAISLRIFHSFLWSTQRLWCSQSVSHFSRSLLSNSVTPWTAAHQASLSIANSWSFQTHVHWVGDAIQPSHPLSSPSSAFNWHSQ